MPCDVVDAKTGRTAGVGEIKVERVRSVHESAVDVNGVSAMCNPALVWPVDAPLIRMSVPGSSVAQSPVMLDGAQNRIRPER